LHIQQLKKNNMKKALFFALLVSCISLTQAQILSFSYNGQNIAEGDTLTLKAASNNEFQFTPAICNDELFNLVCIIECSKLNNTTSEIVSVCTGLLCKDGYVSAPFALAGNTTYDETHIDFDVPADAEMGLFKITVYDTNNRNTQSTMYVKMYNKNGNAGIETSDNSTTFAAYPNPASDKVTVDYSIEEGNAAFVLYSMTGQTIRHTDLSSNEGRIELDVSTLPSGVYMYGIKAGNKTTNLKKLVVR